MKEETSFIYTNLCIDTWFTDSQTYYKYLYNQLAMGCLKRKPATYLRHRHLALETRPSGSTLSGWSSAEQQRGPASRHQHHHHRHRHTHRHRPHHNHHASKDARQSTWLLPSMPAGSTPRLQRRGFCLFSSSCRLILVRYETFRSGPRRSLHHKWTTTRMTRQSRMPDEMNAFRPRARTGILLCTSHLDPMQRVPKETRTQRLKGGRQRCRDRDPAVPRKARLILFRDWTQGPAETLFSGRSSKPARGVQTRDDFSPGGRSSSNSAVCRLPLPFPCDGRVERFALRRRAAGGKSTGLVRTNWTRSH